MLSGIAEAEGAAFSGPRHYLAAAGSRGGGNLRAEDFPALPGVFQELHYHNISNASSVAASMPASVDAYSLISDQPKPT